MGIKEFLKPLHDASWSNAISEARKGRPAELANLLTADGTNVPAAFRNDVRLVIANPVPARRDGGRPPKYTEAQKRSVREIFETFAKGFPAGEDYEALPPMTSAQRSQTCNNLAVQLGVTKKTLRESWGIAVNDPKKPTAKRKKPTQVISPKR